MAPPPPPPEINVRTMQSDMQGIKAATNMPAPQMPKTVLPPEFKKVYTPPTAPIAPIAPPAPKFSIPNDNSPRPQIMSASTPKIEQETGKSTSKKILLWTGAVLIIIGIGLLGYSVVFPRLFPQTSTSPDNEDISTTINPENPPVVTEVPVAPIDQSQTPPIDVTIPPAEPITPSAPVLKPHQAFFKSTDSSASIQLVAADLASFTDALKEESKKAIANNNLVELFISDANGQISGPAMLSLLIPEYSSDVLNANLEEDFTTALFYDANGVWPVYVFKAKDGADLAALQIEIKKMEASANLNNLFVIDPGNKVGAFKDGPVNNNPIRYIKFSKAGAFIDYGWMGDKFIISTSYEGIKKALSNL